MSYELPQPPAVKRERDIFTATMAGLSLVFLLCGLLLGLFTSNWTVAMIFITIAVLGVLAVGLRLIGLRKVNTQEEIVEGRNSADNPGENS